MFEALRAKFESLARDSYGFRRSRRGTYVNPVTSRDWKWFCAGASACQSADLEGAIRELIAAQRAPGGPTGGFAPKRGTMEHERRVALAWQRIHALLEGKAPSQPLPPPPPGQEPEFWRFRWLNPGNSDNVTPEMLEWKPVEPRNPLQSRAQAIKELLAYRFKGIPIYEVQGLAPVVTLREEPDGCPDKLRNGGTCPHHNLHCRYPKCEKGGA